MSLQGEITPFETICKVYMFMRQPRLFISFYTILLLVDRERERNKPRGRREREERICLFKNKILKLGEGEGFFSSWLRSFMMRVD